MRTRQRLITSDHPGIVRRPLGIAVVGGLLFSTFLTLIVVPVVYTLLGRFTGVKVKAEKQKAA